jgi:hypothetical protein
MMIVIYFSKPSSKLKHTWPKSISNYRFAMSPCLKIAVKITGLAMKHSTG